MSKTDDLPVVEIKLADINSNTYNIRGSVDPKTCVDLARRIKVEGLNNPIQIVEVPEAEREQNYGKRYRLFAGFRRFMAHRINGAETIQARVYSGISRVEEIVINFTENSSREDLTLMQEARGLYHLQQLRSMTQKELADEIGKSPKWVQIRLWALDLEQEIQKEIDMGVVKTHHIEQLHSLPAGEPRFAYVRHVKIAKLRGEKPRKSLAKKNVFSKRVRQRVDLFEMQDHILNSLGSGYLSKLPRELRLVNRFLGWAAGEVTDMEIYGELRTTAKENGLYYEIPEDAMSSLQVG